MINLGQMEIFKLKIFKNEQIQQFQRQNWIGMVVLDRRIIWNHYNKFHQSMSEVENNSEIEEPTFTHDNIALNQIFSFLQSSYSDSVCWLFEAIQNLMMDQQLETTRKYLFYIKYLLDFRLKNIRITAQPSLIHLDHQLNFIIQIFLHKISNEKLRQDYPLLFDQFQGAGAFDEYPSFQNIQNPFEMLRYLQTNLDRRQTELIAELMILALTTKQFYLMQANIMLSGCIQSIKEYKGWNLKGPDCLFLSTSQVKRSKSLFQNLLVSIEKI